MSINEYVAGALGGIAGVFVGHPFDTTKIQLQIRTAGDHKVMNSMHAWNMVKSEGLRKGVFRGMMFPLVSYGFVNSVFFGVYGSIIKVLEPDHTITPTHLQVFTAGCVAGTVQLALSCPVEVVKCTMQSQIPLRMVPKSVCLAEKKTFMNSAKYYRGPMHCSKDILAKEGIKGFYKGLMTMFMRDVPSYGLYLLVYEGLFLHLTNHSLSDDRGVGAAVLAGGVAGCLSWLVVMPLDVIKSRLQVDHAGRFRGFWDCAVTSVRNGGYSVLFRGTVITMARAFPVNAMTFLVYSQVLYELNIFNPPVRSKISKENDW
ncbi:hypothetical protein EGW08_021316 [Elysia chlorotica]|uniref:Solute carrier family 25 member 45 n=1 Tax=Elysia chlorotica TaxID=188477 RepID=A0A3S0ZMK2_ELYCH|nr:hypothetical protein EGW08_021316 [Elysia chlorotica]